MKLYGLLAIVVGILFLIAGNLVARADEGEIGTPHSIVELQPGWNLIGGSEQSPQQFYTDHWLSCFNMAIYSWSSVDQVWDGRWFSYLGADSQYVNTIGYLTARRGYWIHCLPFPSF